MTLEQLSKFIKKLFSISENPRLSNKVRITPSGVSVEKFNRDLIKLEIEKMRKK